MDIGRVRRVENRLYLREPLSIAIGERDEIEVAGERLRVVGVDRESRTWLDLERGVAWDTDEGVSVSWVEPADHLAYVVGWERKNEEEKASNKDVVAHAVQPGTRDPVCGRRPGPKKGDIGGAPDVRWRGSCGEERSPHVPRCVHCLELVPLPAPWGDTEWPLYSSL